MSGDPAWQKSILRQVLLWNLGLFVGLGVAGWVADSSALMANAVDNASDAAVYLISYLAIDRQPAWKRWAAMLSGIMLLLFACFVLADVVRRWLGDAEPVGLTMMVLALVAAGINLWCLVLLRRIQSDDVNMQAAETFSFNDFISNGGVLIAGGLVLWIGSPWPDLIAGALIALVAIVGGIGSGKTTLLRVLSGLYSPQSGALKLGGLDMAQIADDVLRKYIGYLPQDYRLVNGTLRDNLLMGIGSTDDAVILAAASKTGLDQTISAHPLGLDLPIHEGGRGLSGGQRTLVGLTRLMLINPNMWILDEPTSNLDANSEAQFMDLIARELPSDRTLVVVTHKLQLLNHFQRVIVMARGKIVADGPRDEVLRRLQANATTVASSTVHPLSRATS